MMRNARGVLAAAAVLAAGVVGGCDSSDGGTAPEGLQVRVYTAPTAPNAFQNVSFMLLKVDGDDLTQPISKLVPYSPGGAGEVPEIPWSGPAGALRQVVVEAWAGSVTGQPTFLVSRGRSLPTAVQEGQFPQLLSVLLAPVNAFLALTDDPTRQVQALEDGRVGQATAVTPSGEVVTSGGGLLAGPGAAWWTPEGYAQIHKSVEVVDERTNARRKHLTGMFFPRVWHSATALPTGQVFFAGGWTVENGALVGSKRVEVYDPGPDGAIQVLANDLAKARAGHSATLVDPASFTILFVGGDLDGQPTFEVWNPVSGSTGARALPDGTGRRFHAATWFEARDAANPQAAPRPAVLIAGGEDASGPLDSVMVYDIISDTMILHPGKLGKGARTMVGAAWVPAQGKIYLTGGYLTLDRQQASNAIDVFDANASRPEDAFVAGIGGFNLSTARGGHDIVRVSDDAVVIAGGTTTGGAVLDSIEIIFQYFQEETDPVTGQSVLRPFITVAFACDDPTCPDVPDMPQPRFGHDLVLMQQGFALLVGGATSDGTTVTPARDLTLYNPR